MHAGIWSNNFDISPVCPSGNCTWPSFQSAGWCSKCEDVTSIATLVGCRNVTAHPDVSEPQYASCNVTLPHGASSSTPIEVKMGHRPVYKMTVPKDIIWTVQGSGILEESIAHGSNDYLGVHNPLLVFAHAELGFSYQTIAGRQPRHPEQYLFIRKATECVLSMCSRTYDVSVSGGVTSRNVSSPDYGEMFLHEYDLGVAFDVAGGYTTNTTCWRGKHEGPANLTPVGPKGRLAAFANASNFAFCPLEEIYRPFVNALVGKTTYTFSGTSLPDVPWQGWTHRMEVGQVPYLLQRILGTGLDTTIANIAASLTKYNLETSNRTVNGTADVPQVFVAVDWTFIILPAVVLGLGILFLVLTILASQGAGLGLWKTSILSALYHGLDDGLLPEGEHATVSSMEKTAQSTDVRLRFSDSKQRLTLQR